LLGVILLELETSADVRLGPAASSLSPAVVTLKCDMFGGIGGGELNAEDCSLKSAVVVLKWETLFKPFGGVEGVL
jgi:hypothetical protein